MYTQLQSCWVVQPAHYCDGFQLLISDLNQRPVCKDSNLDTLQYQVSETCFNEEVFCCIKCLLELLLAFLGFVWQTFLCQTLFKFFEFQNAYRKRNVIPWLFGEDCIYKSENNDCTNTMHITVPSQWNYLVARILASCCVSFQQRGGFTKLSFFDMQRKHFTPHPSMMSSTSRPGSHSPQTPFCPLKQHSFSFWDIPTWFWLMS